MDNIDLITLALSALAALGGLCVPFIVLYVNRILSRAHITLHTGFLSHHDGYRDNKKPMYGRLPLCKGIL